MNPPREVVIKRKGDVWLWEEDDLQVEASDARIQGGTVRAVISIRKGRALDYRSTVNLTSEPQRERLLRKVQAAGEELLGPVLIALDEAIRSDPRPSQGADHAGAGTAMLFSDPEPWPTPVDGSELLDDLANIFPRFLALRTGVKEVLTLWTLHTHAHDGAEVSPLLGIISPVKRCGKTRTLAVLEVLVHRPLKASNVTVAAVFRTIEKFKPTLLIDEADTFLPGREELRGILNSGHMRASAFVVRLVGNDHEPRQFSTWAPKAVALIGELPDTLADRAILIRMRRRDSEELVEEFRSDRILEFEPLRRKAARWARDNMEALRLADTDVPDGLDDRAADNWRPLLAIADLAGGDWPERARRAALLLSGADSKDDGSSGTLLLGDLRDLFERVGTDRMPSEEITQALAEMEDRPWPEWGHKRQPLTKRSLAALLKPYGVHPKVIRLPNGSTPRGYTEADLVDAWSRYLPPKGGMGVQHPPHPNDGGEKSDMIKRNRPRDVADDDPSESPHGDRMVADVAAVDPPLEDDPTCAFQVPNLFPDELIP